MVDQSKNHQVPTHPYIMVIGDQRDILEEVTRDLEQSGFRVESFTSPHEAVEHFKKNPGVYSAVLTDIRMPGVSGFGVARDVKRTNPRVKVIVFTSFEIMKSEFSKVMPSTEVDDFISKPATTEHILGVLSKHIGKSEC